VLIGLSSDRLAPDAALLAAARAVSMGGTDGGSSAAYPQALTWVLSGGEDHALAATFPAGTALPPRWTVIGDVGESPGQPGVLVDGQPHQGPAGWDHFAG
jgi:thiamine monophosphate kinase